MQGFPLENPLSKSRLKACKQGVYRHFANGVNGKVNYTEISQ